MCKCAKWLIRNIVCLSATLTLVTPTLKMSTQHIGDEPPGDKEYYDLVEEEIIRATGSGRNPNAAAWDPEKIELRRIVNRLLALEERRALAVRPVEHAVPHKVKLPGFWEKDVAAWFRLTEAVMEDNQVVQQRVMYRTVLLNIRTTCWRGPGAF